MSCTMCSAESKCPHSKRSSINSIFMNKKMKKPSEDEEVVPPCVSSSADTSSDRPPGFMKYIKRCFKLHFPGNSLKKHKSKMVKASEVVETECSVPEASSNSLVDPIIISPDCPTSSPDPLTTFSDPQTSAINPVTIPNAVISHLKPQTSPPDPEAFPSNPDYSKADTSGTTITVNNTQKSLAVELLNLSKYGWYWGPITQAEAVEKLQDQPDGSFLVRDSYADHFLVSMSFKTLGQIYHARINHSNGHFFFYTSPNHSCASIPELIEVSMDSSKSSIFCYSRPRSPCSPSLPIRLTTPISRFTEVRSLQHLCRFVIRQYTRIDQIKQLPLPNRLCGYLEARQI